MYYQMEHIENFRDLSGIRTRDGKKVAAGKLFRCAELCDATKNDIAKIRELGIDTIVDFRSTAETLVRKDPDIGGVSYRHINLFKERLDGVEKTNKEERFYEWMIEQSFDYPSRFADQMVNNYSTLVSEEYPINGYRQFFEILLSKDSERILWHCSAGKDRTGIAAILLLEALDADKEEIYENYLQTNLYLTRSYNEVLDTVKERAGHHEAYEEIRDSFSAAMSASRNFIDACYSTMDELSGSPQAYLKEYMRIGEEEKKILKDKYLED